MSSNVITHGVIYGLISIVLSFLSFNGMIGSGLLSIISLAVFILVLISAGRKYKANHDGYASMGDLVKTFALVLILGLVMSTIFSFAYTMMMSEDKKEAFVENIVEAQMETMAKFIPEDALEEQEENLYNSTSRIFEPTGILMNLLMGALFAILISLIPAAIMKKNPQQHL